MRLAGRAGIAERARAAEPLSRLALGGLAAFFVIVAVAAIGAAVVTPRSQAACAPSLAGGELKGLPPEAREYARLYLAAADEYELGPRGPAILASIHQTESGFGANLGPSSAGAIGHMQFLPSTWEAMGVDANGDGRKDPYDAADAIHGAARYLSASGAAKDWYEAIFTYNNADWYVQEILAGAKGFGDLGAVADATCEPASGPADLAAAVRVYEPARDLQIPARYMAAGFAPDPIDARIWPNVRWMLETYDLLVTAGKETGHASHGDGSAIDAVPAGDLSSQAAWDDSAGRLAADLGWTRGCGHSGSRPVCDLVPAIEWVGYDGYASHGSPATCGGSCPMHLHVSWVSSTHGTPHLTTPEWLMVFPSPTAPPRGDSQRFASAPEVPQRGLLVRAPARSKTQALTSAPRARRTSFTRSVARRSRALSVPKVNDPGRPGAGGRT